MLIKKNLKLLFVFVCLINNFYGSSFINNRSSFINSPIKFIKQFMQNRRFKQLENDFDSFSMNVIYSHNYNKKIEKFHILKNGFSLYNFGKGKLYDVNNNLNLYYYSAKEINEINERMILLKKFIENNDENKKFVSYVNDTEKKHLEYFYTQRTYSTDGKYGYKSTMQTLIEYLENENADPSIIKELNEKTELTINDEALIEKIYIKYFKNK